MKKKLFKHALLALAGIGIMAGSASASLFGSSDLDGNTNGVLEMLNGSFFGVNTFVKVDTPFDFEGVWNYTAIASEAGHVNIVREVNTNPITTFRTNATSNFGLYEQVDFDSQNLRFRDLEDGDTQLLDRYTVGKTDIFSLYRLTEDSQSLTWLGPNAITLKAGTYILGFNDNFGIGDEDFDDIIMAMTPVPEPATMLLFGIGTAGLIGFARKRRLNK